MFEFKIEGRRMSYVLQKLKYMNNGNFRYLVIIFSHFRQRSFLICKKKKEKKSFNDSASSSSLVLVCTSFHFCGVHYF